jgi:acetylornithine deacetylase
VPLDVVETLAGLVAVPSVNPMGGPMTGPEQGEAKLTDHLESIFADLGLPSRRHEVEPGRENIVARLDGDVPPERGGQVLLFGVHQDTVPATGMTIEPFEPAIREGRLYGRGACDVKGGMAAMLAALSRLAERPSPGMPTVLMACTVNEECGFTGASALAGLCAGPGDPVPRLPDAAVVAEPTALNIVVAHKGVIRWRARTLGRAGHSAYPEAGDSAIYGMARVLVALERYDAEVLTGLDTHPRCGRATLSVGTIRGGLSVNTIPDRATIEIDRRLRPDESPEDAYRHAVAFLRDTLGADFPLEHEPPFMAGLALSDEANGPLADRLEAVVKEVTGNCRREGVPFATDGAFLAAEGIPVVVFGPGSIEQAHTPDEWIALDQLHAAADVYERFARTF